MRSFEGSFRNLKFSPSTSILLNFFFPFTDTKCFFSSLKLQYRRAIVLLNKLKLSFLKKPLFQKRRWSCDFPPRKTRLPKSTARFPAKKRWYSPLPVGLPWDFPHPPPESVRTYADVTTKIFRIDTLPSRGLVPLLVNFRIYTRRGPKKLRFILSNQKELRTRAQK